MAQGTTDVPQTELPMAAAEVLTLTEAAGYLRVSEADILQLVQSQGLPGRRVGADWRFLKAAIQDWLRIPGKEEFWSTHFGALKDDPNLEEMVGQIYRDRDRDAAGEDA